MSKIERYQGDVKAFASNAQGLERTVFGGTAQANDLTSQITAAFLRGWGIVGPSEHPSLEDFNAAMFALSQFIAYQHQVGVPEWHTEQEYHSGSVCTHGGVSYQSLDDENTGNEPPSAKWTPVLTAKNGGDYFQPKNANLAALAGLAGAANRLPYFTGANALALTALTAVGRDLIGKATVAEVLTYLGLGDLGNSGIVGASSGLKISTTGNSHPVSVSAAAVCLENASGSQRTVKNLALQLNLSTPGVNGLDTGVLAASTWYAVHIIYNGVTTAVIGSLSATAPTLPAGYTYAGRVGWIRTDSSANKYPLSMVQVGKSSQYKVATGSNVPNLPIIITGAYSTPAAANVATLVPPSAGKIKLAAGITGTGYVGFAPNNSYSSAPGSNYLSASTPTGYPFVGGYNASSPVPTANGELVLEAMTVYYAANGAGGILQCVGWEEF